MTDVRPGVYYMRACATRGVSCAGQSWRTRIKVLVAAVVDNRDIDRAMHHSKTGDRNLLQL